MTNDVSPQVLLAFLNDAWGRAADTANSLRVTIVSDQVNALVLVKQGSIASVGKNSTSQSYKGYGPGSLTQVQIVEAIGNLLGFYDQIAAKIKAEFLHSADFEYTEPAGFDYDNPVFSTLTEILTQLSAGSVTALPDIRDLRVPIWVEERNVPHA